MVVDKGQVWIRGVDVSDLFENATYGVSDDPDMPVRIELELIGWGRVFGDGKSRNVRHKS